MQPPEGRRRASRPRAQRRHLVDPGVPRAHREGRSLGPARRRLRAASARAPARTSSSASSTRASGRSSKSVLGPQGSTAADGNLYPQRHRVPRDLPGRRAVPSRQLQQQGARRSVVQRRVGRHRGAEACDRGSSCRRATTAATARTPRPTAGGNFGIQPTGDAAFFSPNQRHGAARTHRHLQGCWSTQDARPRAASRPTSSAAIDAGRRGRRRCHQLLDQRDDDSNFHDPSRSRSCSQRRRVSSCPRRPATPALARPLSPTRARGSRRSPPARTTARATAP